MRAHRDLERVAAAAVLCALVAVLVPLEAIRILGALPLALFLPGYAITAASFGPRRLETPQLLLLSVAMSLIALVVASLFLTLLPGGLNTVSWAVLLVVIVLAACRGAAVRRGPRARRRPGRGRPRLGVLDAGFLGAAALLAAAAIVLSQVSFSATDADGYTALWMLPTAGKDAVEIGVTSARQASGRFRLEVKTEPGAAPAIAKFRLDPGDERVFTVPVGSRQAGRSVPVVASLYKAGEPHRLYRRVNSWLSGGAHP
jgi:hypothetical protein